MRFRKYGRVRILYISKDIANLLYDYQHEFLHIGSPFNRTRYG